MKQIDKSWIGKLGYGQLIRFNQFACGGSIDSRKIRENEIFFALQGENTDGHKFVKDAHQRGASLVVVDDKVYQEKKASWTEIPIWVVPSVEAALMRCAAMWRNEFAIPVIAITGSNGKTSTRSLISHLLSGKYTVHATRGNLNNQLGVPLTLLSLNDTHEISVMEIGANHPGEIAELTRIIKPTQGLITNVGFAHTEFFGGIEGVARAKAELFESILPSGITYVNSDDEYIPDMPTCTEHVIRYGIDSVKVDFKGAITGFSDDGYAFISVNDYPVFRTVMGGYSGAINSLAAFTVSHTNHLNYHEIIQQLSSFSAVEGRFQVINRGNRRFIDDTYNANPDSAVDSIRTLSIMKTDGKKVVILGDMLELGKWKRQGYRFVANAIVECQIDLLLTVGETIGSVAEYVQGLSQVECHKFPSKKSVTEFIKMRLSPDDLILVKGSRACKMEEIIEGASA